MPVRECSREEYLNADWSSGRPRLQSLRNWLQRTYPGLRHIGRNGRMPQYAIRYRTDTSYEEQMGPEYWLLNPPPEALCARVSLEIGTVVGWLIPINNGAPNLAVLHRHDGVSSTLLVNLGTGRILQSGSPRMVLQFIHSRWPNIAPGGRLGSGLPVGGPGGPGPGPIP